MQSKQTMAGKRPSGNIFMVGMMGAGKTTVGKILAGQMGKQFIDADEEIRRRTGVTIPHIFDIEGESGFRQREAAVIQELVQLDNIVLATGGGAVLDKMNRDALRDNGVVVYLNSSVQDLWNRTRHDRNRPLLKTDDPYAVLKSLCEQRGPLYLEIADLVMPTGKQGAQSLVKDLIKKLKPLMDISPQQDGTVNHQDSSMMQTITVGLGERSYPIHIGRRLLPRAELLMPLLPHKRVAVVSNITVAPLYLEPLRVALQGQGVEVIPVILPDGEQYKNAETLGTIYDALMANRCERSTPLIALGGGVIGDLTGYAAATYLRGVPFIQMPTTLLAQVDSSVGGKTGINHPLGKNMIGAFYQPQLVLADIDTLNTLPDPELRAGIAEVIKYGLIRDLPFFEWLESNMEELLARDAAALQYAIARSCRNKAEVVAADERESGERALLNLGHTFGHAIETGTGYGTWLHGEAVAAGTLMAADLSCRLGWIGNPDTERIRNLFQRAGLPQVAPDLGTDAYLQLMGLDKKVVGGRMRFVLLRQIGQAVVSADVPEDVLRQTLEACIHG